MHRLLPSSLPVAFAFLPLSLPRVPPGLRDAGYQVRKARDIKVYLIDTYTKLA